MFPGKAELVRVYWHEVPEEMSGMKIKSVGVFFQTRIFAAEGWNMNQDKGIIRLGSKAKNTGQSGQLEFLRSLGGLPCAKGFV